MFKGKQVSFHPGREPGGLSALSHLPFIRSKMIVSIPDGSQGPFSHYNVVDTLLPGECFHPGREPGAFSPLSHRVVAPVILVSIPDGSQGPFSHGRRAFLMSSFLRFPSRTGARGLLACCASTIAPEAEKSKRLRDPHFWSRIHPYQSGPHTP